MKTKIATMKYRKIYKAGDPYYISDCKIVSMSPGDLVVAGCFNFSLNNFGGAF